jgi:hypothetical protein
MLQIHEIRVGLSRVQRILQTLKDGLEEEQSFDEENHPASRPPTGTNATVSEMKDLAVDEDDVQSSSVFDLLLGGIDDLEFSSSSCDPVLTSSFERGLQFVVRASNLDDPLQLNSLCAEIQTFLQSDVLHGQDLSSTSVLSQFQQLEAMLVEKLLLVKSLVLQKAELLLSSSGEEKSNQWSSPEFLVRDFQIVSLISKGGYGYVFLARRISSGDLVALKVFPFQQMTEESRIAFLRERDILYLTSSESQYLISFYFSFATQNCAFLVLEYASGGDLFSLLQNLGILDEETTAFYIAELVLAIEALHHCGVVHRDIKVCFHLVQP